jgi:uncharacterized protein (DUF983 family)
MTTSSFPIETFTAFWIELLETDIHITSLRTGSVIVNFTVVQVNDEETVCCRVKEAIDSGELLQAMVESHATLFEGVQLQFLASNPSCDDCGSDAASNSASTVNSVHLAAAVIVALVAALVVLIVVAKVVFRVPPAAYNSASLVPSQVESKYALGVAQAGAVECAILKAV